MKPLSTTVSALPVSAALSVDLNAKAEIARGIDVMNFCVGEPDFSAPEHARLAGVQAIDAGGMKYTNACGTETLRRAIGQALLRDCGLKYAPSDIVVTAGAKYAVFAAVRALVNRGDEVILPAPFWTSYYHIITLAGAVPVVVKCAPEQQWKLTPQQLASAVTDRTKALLLNNPNNPTGAVYMHSELSALAAVCRAHDLYVVSDEIYSRLLYTDEPFCAAASVNADMFERTVTINGVSKAYAMTGWRIGYAAANPAVIRAMYALVSHTTGSPNTAAQSAAEAALLGAQDGTERMRRTLLVRRERMDAELSSVPHIRYTVPQGAFYVLLDVRALLGGAYQDDAALALALLESESVATVPCTDYGAPGFLRLSLTLPEERIVEGVRRIKRFIENREAS